MPALAYDRKPERKCTSRPRDDYHTDFVAPATPPANPISIGFSPTLIEFRPLPADFGAAPRRAASSPSQRFGRGAGRYVETSHPRLACGQQSGTIAGLFLAPRRTDYA
jgi:hypothetical protein